MIRYVRVVLVDRELGGLDLREDLVQSGPRRHGNLDGLSFRRGLGFHHRMGRGIEEEEPGDRLIGDDEETIDSREISGLEEMHRFGNGLLGVGGGRQIEGPFRRRDDEVVRCLGDRLEVVLQRRSPSDDGVSFEIGQPAVLQHQENQERSEDREDPHPQEAVLTEHDPFDPREFRPGTVTCRRRRRVILGSHGVWLKRWRLRFPQNIAQAGGSGADFCSLVTSVSGFFDVLRTLTPTRSEDGWTFPPGSAGAMAVESRTGRWAGFNSRPACFVLRPGSAPESPAGDPPIQFRVSEGSVIESEMPSRWR